MTPNTTTPPIEVPDTAREMVEEAKTRWKTYFPPPIDYDRIRTDTEGGKRLVRAILGKEREGE